MLSRKIGTKGASANLLRLAIRNNYLAKRGVSSSSTASLRSQSQNSLFALNYRQQVTRLGGGKQQMLFGTRYFSSGVFNLNQQAQESLNSSPTKSASEKEEVSEDSVEEQEGHDKQKRRQNERREYTQEERAERRNEYIRRTKENYGKLKEEIDSTLQNGSINDAFEQLSKTITDLESKNRFDSFIFGQVLKETLDNSLQKSIADAEAPLDASKDLISVTPLAILQFYMDNGVVQNKHFVFVLSHLIRTEKLKEAISLYVDFSGYADGKRYLTGSETDKKEGKDRSINVKIAGLISYLMYTAKYSIQPDGKYVKSIFKIQNLPSPVVIQDRYKKWELAGNASEANVEAGKEKKDFLSAALRNYSKLRLYDINLENPAILDRVRAQVEEGNYGALNREIEFFRSVAKIQERKIPESIYAGLIQLEAKINNATSAFFLWNEMVKNGIVPSIESWNALVIAVSKKGVKGSRSEQIEALYKKLLEQPQLKPNAGTYAALIQAYSNAEDYTKAKKVYAELQDSSKNKFKVPISYKITKEYLMAVAKDDVAGSFKKMLYQIKNNDFIPDIVLLNCYLSIFVKVGNFDKAQEIMALIQQYGLKADVATYTTILDMVFKQTRKRGEVVTEEVLTELLKEMESNGLSMSPVTYSSMIDGLSKDGVNITAARRLFAYLQSSKSISKTTYTSMIHAEFRFGNFDKAEALFQDYLSTSHDNAGSNNVQMFNLMVTGFSNANNAEKAYEYFLKIDELSNGKPNMYSYYFILRASLYGNKTEIAEKVLEHLGESNLTHYGSQMPTVIKKLSAKGANVPQTVLAKASQQQSKSSA